MRILAIDPGTTESAFVILDGLRIVKATIVPNPQMLKIITRPVFSLGDETIGGVSTMAVEMIEGLGMPVGKETFETVWWIGRFCEAWKYGDGSEAHRVYRKDVKIHLCGSYQAKDANIRQALLDKLGPQGTKKKPGPTYGISKHMWAALAVGITWIESGNR